MRKATESMEFSFFPLRIWKKNCRRFFLHFIALVACNFAHRVLFRFGGSSFFFIQKTNTCLKKCSTPACFVLFAPKCKWVCNLNARCWLLMNIELLVHTRYLIVESLWTGTQIYLMHTEHYIGYERWERSV